MGNNALRISVYNGSEDFEMFKTVINQGIDSRLEGFTKSKFCFDENDNRHIFNFHPSEIQILLRRLCEYYDTDEYAINWIDDIIDSWYGYQFI